MKKKNKTKKKKKNENKTIKIFFDYKSPYSYLILDPINTIQKEFEVAVDWKPFIFKMEEFFGVPEKRNIWQTNKVKYSYFDIRREANRRGNMLIYGPKKAYDSTVSLCGSVFLLKHSNQEAFESYHLQVFKRFFERKLNIENLDEISDLIDQVGASSSDFVKFIPEAKKRLEEIEKEAADIGVFGTPTVIDSDNEIFFGNDRIHLLREKLSKKMK